MFFRAEDIALSSTFQHIPQMCYALKKINNNSLHKNVTFFVQHKPHTQNLMPTLPTKQQLLSDIAEGNLWDKMQLSLKPQKDYFCSPLHKLPFDTRW